MVARVSRHILRLEREFQLAKEIVSRSDSKCQHFVRPIELVRLPSRPGQESLIASIFEAPGENYVKELVQLGPNAYKGVAKKDSWEITSVASNQESLISLRLFLDFAVGAAACCEVLHHGNRIVHGELRGDAFHFDQSKGLVKMINFGSGARSFENGLTSAGWASLSLEVGVEHKLQFIAPEQTGRLPAEPDLRTDIYSLGILFWMMLTGEVPFEGSTPLDVMQSVLSRRLPPLSSRRMDIPDALASIIQKMTQRNIEDRYNSTSGVKHDLVQVSKMLSNGDMEGIKTFKIGTKDISSYFMLPSRQLGRDKERGMITAMMKSLSKRQWQSSHMNSLSSNSSISRESQVLEDLASDSTSSRESESRIGSGVEVSALEALRDSHNATSNTPPDPFPHDRLEARYFSNTLSSDTRTPVSALDSSIHRSSSVRSDADSPSALLRKAQRLRRRGRCEVISINGAAGLGKSSLVQSIQVSARKHGYFAVAKFDQAKNSPYDPVLRLMSSLFRQIFSESDVNTEFHNTVRSFVNPVWPALHSWLDLPEWLLNSGKSITPVANNSRSLLVRNHASRRASSPSTYCSSTGSTGSATAEWLQSGASANSSKFSKTFLDVLRLLASEKFICCCIDDLQFADHESLDLIQNIIVGKIPMMLILTFREEETLLGTARSILSSATPIQLKPFPEEVTAEYVSETLHRSADYVLPLVAVIQEKTRGNPFLLREMLQTCWRTGCIYYSWQNSVWEYDLDKIFTEFASEAYGEQMTNGFLTKRLKELPSVTKSLLAWASLIGNTFSFSLVTRLMRGEKCARDVAAVPVIQRSDDPVAGLQSALSAVFIMTGDNEDRFRFSHDRYMTAAACLAEEYDTKEMHFAIAKCMIASDFQDPTTSSKSLYIRCRHVCLAVDLIKNRVQQRKSYRDMLYQAAEIACDSGARSTALYYFDRCLTLLQEDPWDDTKEDVDYHETLRLFTRTAECYWYQGFFEAALGLLQTTFDKARDAVDKAPSWILQSRIYAMRGDSFAAFHGLKKCLIDLGLVFNEATWEECDAEFHRLCSEIQRTGSINILGQPTTNDRTLQTMGVVLVELLSAAFWSNSLLFYQMTLHMVALQLTRGTFSQISLGYVHLASITIGRFNMSRLGIEFGNIAKAFFARFPEDHFTLGRGQTLHALFLGHLETASRDQIAILHSANQETVLAGDRILSLLNLGVVALFRLWSSHDLYDIEVFIDEAPFEFKNWTHDFRGGVLLVTMRQYVRALQGKTNWRSATTIFSDEHHQSSEYLRLLDTQASNPKRPRTFYLSEMLAALFRFGHMKEAIATGEKLLPLMDSLFCIRLFYSNLFYLSLALLSNLRTDPEGSNADAEVARVKTYAERIRASTEFNDINYRTWILLLDAELASVTGKYRSAMEAYEAALEHCELTESTLDEALAYELYAEFLIRQGSSRLAKRLLIESASRYRRMSALGKCEQLNEKYPFLVIGLNIGTSDALCQTDIVDTGNTSYKLAQNEDHATQKLGAETSHDRTQAWLQPRASQSMAGSKKVDSTNTDLGAGFSAVGLDMIDLTSILESTQVLSSELQVDRLLCKMTEIILESTAADLGAIVIEEEQNGWGIAAIGTPDGVMSYPGGQGLETVDDQVARQITLCESKASSSMLNFVDFHRCPPIQGDRLCSKSAGRREVLQRFRFIPQA